MEIRPFPGFAAQWRRRFFAVWAYIALSTLLLIVAGRQDLLPHPYLVIAAQGVIAVGLALWHGITPYLVHCPACDGATITRRFRPQVPDSFSALCKRCDILWDLKLGSGEAS